MSSGKFHHGGAKHGGLRFDHRGKLSHGIAKVDHLTPINPALYCDRLAGPKKVQFDWAKFNWIGSAD